MNLRSVCSHRVLTHPGGGTHVPVLSASGDIWDVPKGKGEQANGVQVQWMSVWTARRSRWSG